MGPPVSCTLERSSVRRATDLDTLVEQVEAQNEAAGCRSQGECSQTVG